MLHPSFGLLLNCQRPSNQSDPLQGCVDHKEPFIEVESIWPSKIEIYTEFSQSRNSPRKHKKTRTREGSSQFTAVPCHLFLRLSRSRYRPWQPEIRLVTSQVLRRLLYLYNLYKWWFEKKWWESETIRKLSRNAGTISFSCFFVGPFFSYGFKVSTVEWSKRCNKQLTVETVDLFHHRAVEGPQQQCLQRYWRRGQALASCDCRKGKP